jgi:hypothetical protein
VRWGQYVAQIRGRRNTPQSLVTNVAGKENETENLATIMKIILKWIEKIPGIMGVAGIICIGTGSSGGGGGGGDNWGGRLNFSEQIAHFTTIHGSNLARR